MMSEIVSPLTILMADDDPDDCLLVRDAIEETGASYELYVVRDGEELVDYLHRRGKFARPHVAPRPDLILLDLKMPKRNGHEALADVKNDPELRKIPVVALTTSRASNDIQMAYDLGVNSYIRKPATFRSLVDTMRILLKYWAELVELPMK